MLLSHFPEKNQYMKLSEKHTVIPVCAEILADTETPVSLLKNFTTGEVRSFFLKVSRAESDGAGTVSWEHPHGLALKFFQLMW